MDVRPRSNIVAAAREGEVMSLQVGSESAAGADVGVTLADYATAGIAAFALVVSVVGVVTARRAERVSAKAAHRARTPELVARFVPASGGHYNLQLMLRGPVDLKRLQVDLASVDVSRGRGVLGISDARQGSNEPHSPSVDLGPIRVAETRDLWLWRSGSISRAEVRLRCTCEAEDEAEPWLVAVEVIAPRDA